MNKFAAALLLGLIAASPAAAVETSMQLVLELTGNAERDVVPYECEGLEPFEVEYINAEPIFLAFVPIDGERLIFVNVLSARGTRFASGSYLWSTRGGSAELLDLTQGEDAEPISCVEATETP